MYKTCENIRKARRSLNLTQKELASRLDVTASSIAQIESGKKLPKIATIIKIANALECTPWIIADIGDYSSSDLSELESIEPLHTESERTILNAFGIPDVSAVRLKPTTEDMLRQLARDMFHLQDEERLLALFRKLNDYGQGIAIRRMEELTMIPWYTDEDEPLQDASNQGTPRKKRSAIVFRPNATKGKDSAPDPSEDDLNE